MTVVICSTQSHAERFKRILANASDPVKEIEAILRGLMIAMPDGIAEEFFFTALRRQMVEGY